MAIMVFTQMHQRESNAVLLRACTAWGCWHKGMAMWNGLLQGGTDVAQHIMGQGLGRTEAGAAGAAAGRAGVGGGARRRVRLVAIHLEGAQKVLQHNSGQQMKQKPQKASCRI